MEGTRRHRLDDAFNLTAGEQFQVAADTPASSSIKPCYIGIHLLGIFVIVCLPFGCMARRSAL
jgi:hypothetical protein